MLAHLRSNLWFLFLSLLLCAVLYPTILWIVAQTLFPNSANGSLIVGKDGQTMGSRLIAQPFGDTYFQPRPSAASYNGAASAASNWGANNYLLRDRVARQLGPIARYGTDAERFGKTPGEGVQADLEAWFHQDRYQGQPEIVARWLGLHPGLAESWVKGIGEALKGQWKQGDEERPGNEAFALQWAADMPELFDEWKKSKEYADWKQTNADADSPSNADLVQAFLASFSRKYPGEWPTLEDYQSKDNEKRKRFTRVTDGSEIQSVFFDMWRQDHPDVPLEAVPADMVMASGSGLDPHITLDNAHYQLKYRIAVAQADKLVADRAAPQLQGDISESRRKEVLAEVRGQLERKAGGDLEAKIRDEIGKILEAHREAPLGGLVGVPIVNVLETNLDVRARMEKLADAWR